MFNRQFSVITAGSLFLGIALTALPQLGFKAIAATSPSGTPQVETLNSTDLVAQRGEGSGQRRHGGRRDRWIDQLDLTDAQKTQIQAIRKKYRPQVEVLRNRARNASREERQAIREEGRTLRSQIKAEIDAVLTQEQRQRADQLRQERRQNRQERRSNRQSQ